MIPFTRIIGLAAAGALIAFTAVGTPAHAGDPAKAQDQPCLKRPFSRIASF